MKFDIVRAWKDESYRESLSAEQISLLPANPVGELTEAELATISGAGGFPAAGVGGVGAAAVPAVAAAVAPVFQRNESIALICEINIFSVNVIANIAILGSVTQVCAKG